MIRIRVVAVGKLKEKYWTDAVSEYLKRLSRYARVEVTECPEGVLDQSPAANKKQEAEGILSKCKGYVVLTDSRGEQLTSEEFAKMLDRESARGATRGGRKRLREGRQNRFVRESHVSAPAYEGDIARAVVSRGNYNKRQRLP